MSKIVRTQPAKAGQQITVTDAQGRSFQSEAIGEIVDDKGVAFQVDGQWKVAGNSNSKQQSRTTIERHQPKKKTEVALYPFIRLYLSDSKGYKDGDGYKGKMIDQNLLFVIGGVNLGKGRDKFILIGYDNNTQSWFLKAGSSLINMSPTLTEVQEALLETSYYYLGHKFLKPKEANNLIVYPSLISEISNGSYGLLRKNRDDAYQKNDANINTPY
jgi:hypothetical protein